MHRCPTHAAGSIEDLLGGVAATSMVLTLVQLQAAPVHPRDISSNLQLPELRRQARPTSGRALAGSVHEVTRHLIVWARSPSGGGGGGLGYEKLRIPPQPPSRRQNAKPPGRVIIWTAMARRGPPDRGYTRCKMKRILYSALLCMS